MSDWIKLYRELFDKPIWLNSTPPQKVLLMVIMARANYKENQWDWDGKKFRVKPGQFVTSLESLKRRCGDGVSTQNIRTGLKRFEKLEFLTSQVTNRGRIITILNWCKYQQQEKPPNIATNKPLTSPSQALNKPLTTNKKVRKKEGNKERLNNPPIIPPMISQPLWEDYLKMRKEIKAPMTDRAKKLFVTEIEKLMAQGYDPEKLVEASLLNNWKSVYKPKDNGGKPQQKTFQQITRENTIRNLNEWERTHEG